MAARKPVPANVAQAFVQGGYPQARFLTGPTPRRPGTHRYLPAQVPGPPPFSTWTFQEPSRSMVSFVDPRFRQQTPSMWQWAQRPYAPWIKPL